MAQDRYATVTVTRASTGVEDFHDVRDVYVETNPSNLKEVRLRITFADNPNEEVRDMGRGDLLDISFA